MTANEMVPAVGKSVLVRCEDLAVWCWVLDAKMSYGKPRIQVRPFEGRGEQWIELSRVIELPKASATIPNDHKLISNQFGWTNGNPEAKA